MLLVVGHVVVRLVIMFRLHKHYMQINVKLVIQVVQPAMTVLLVIVLLVQRVGH